jgi:hypothetical protein
MLHWPGGVLGIKALVAALDGKKDFSEGAPDEDIPFKTKYKIRVQERFLKVSEVRV